MTDNPKIRGMLIFTAEGPRSVADDSVLFVYREATTASYCGVTVVLHDGREVSGRALTAAVVRIERELAKPHLPPAA